MITIQLDPAKEQRLRKMAEAQGQEAAQLAQRVLEDYIDAQGWNADSAEDWAAASVVLAPEVLTDKAWDDGGAGHGSG